jgi:hypothetical protein
MLYDQSLDIVIVEYRYGFRNDAIRDGKDFRSGGGNKVATRMPPAAGPWSAEFSTASLVAQLRNEG